MMKNVKKKMYRFLDLINKQGGGVSSFFLSSWRKERILEETALAFKKAKANPSIYNTSGNAYNVLSTDNILLEFFYGINGQSNPLLNGTTNPIIKSSFPKY